MADGLWTVWTATNRVPAHTAHSPYDDGVALFSANKWPCFRLSRFRRVDPNGPLFGKQVALFSLTKTPPSPPVLWHGPQ